MGNKLASGAALTRSYDDFEPFCDWQREEGCDTLKLHLPDFKKNQLKVQINNRGILTITGERPVGETKWSRFSKQTRVSENCNANEIRAKLVGGLLYIKMPKKIMHVATQDERTLIQQSSIEDWKPKPETNQDHEVTGKPTVNESNGAGKKSISSENATVCSTSSENARLSKPENYKFGLQSLVSGLKMNKKVAVSVVVAVAVVVGIGAYVTYRYHQSSHVEN